jgi:ABC-type nitrate/sulfonate/bicarbonate transport system substrate-binding protein
MLNQSTVELDKKERTALEVGIVSKTFFYVPVWSAIEQGIFEKYGLTINLSILGNQSQADRLLDGSMDIAIATPEAAIQNAASGGPLRIVAGNTGKLSHSFITRPEFKRIEDLRGATIGVLNMVEGSFYQVREIMAQHGLHYPHDYRVQETGGVPPRHRALLDGKIDAGLQSIPWNFLAEETGMRNHGEVVNYIPDWQFVSINASAEWAARNQETLVRFLQAMLEATDWVYRNPDGAAEIAVRELPTSLVHAKRAWDYYTSTNALTYDLSINPAGLKKVLDTQVEAGLLQASVNRELDYYVEGKYLDMAKGRYVV